VAVFLPLLHIFFPSDTSTWAATLATNTIPVVIDFWGVIGVAHAVEYYRRAQERDRVAAQLKAQLTEAQLQALRSQLHPHFLFNTLNGVATLMHRDVDAADRMVTDLADLLRATLQHSGAHEIPLREELTLLQRYLAIVGTRFRDRLTVSYDIAPEVEDALVPQFLLQPLAENAVEHGIAQLVRPGAVVVGARRTDDDVILTVTDDGPGLRGGAPHGHGVGLANTRARLEELYGSRQHLTLEPATASGGVRVTVTIPYRRRSAPTWNRPTLDAVV
jgi:LytS/YehU family sensor histidine kinase